MGVAIGVETELAVSRLVTFGTDEGIAQDLLAACERGFVGAINEKDDDGQD